MTENKTFLIPNKLCERSGVSFSWLPINQIGVFPYARKHYGAPDNPTQHHPAEVSLFHLRQDVILFTPILRKLVNEASGTFLKLQQMSAKKTASFSTDLLKISREYRSIIRACLENLQEEIVKDTEYDEDLQNYVTIFYSIECIWHLCEILFLDTMPGNSVLPHLLDWISFHFPKYERNAAEMLCGDLVALEQNSEYWDTVIGSLLQGRIKVARGLLKYHSCSDTDAFRLADHTLKTMPIYDILEGISVQEFTLQWRHWLVETQTKIDAKLFSSNRNIELIMKLVVGDELAWCEVQHQCETWYELLAAWLFFTEPTVKSFELGQYAKECINKMNLNNKLKHLDRVLLAAMEFDILEVIKEIQGLSESGWFATHLVNLFIHAGKLKPLEKDIKLFSSIALHDSLILDYGTLLMGHKSLWQVGLTYLDHCKTHGRGAIKLLLPRISADNELRANKIIREAQKRRLPKIAQVVCKIQGMKSLQQNRLGNALTWALKSQDSIFVSSLADRFLKEYTKNGRLFSTDLLFNLGSSMLASDRLIFLGKYYEFHKLYVEKQYKEAGNLLIRLMESKIIPTYFWYILLIEAIPLLECEEMVFSSNDTYMIMNSIQEHENCKHLNDKLDILRFAAARNLSRAIIYEAQLE